MADNWFSGRVDELQEGIDELAAGDEIEQTNQLLARLIQLQAEAAGIEDPELGYYAGGNSTASHDQEASRTTLTEEVRQARVHWGKRVQVSSGDTQDDPKKVALPFIAELFDLRDWSGTLYVAWRDPEQTSGDGLWAEYDGSRDDPVSEIPANTGTVWLATPSGSSASPLVDAWRHGLNGP